MSDLDRDVRALQEIVRLCDLGARIAARGYDWYLADPDGVPGLAFESLVIKIGENVARVSPERQASHTDVPWSAMKRMRDRLAHHYEGTDYAVVWSTVTTDFPHLRRLIANVI